MEDTKVEDPAKEIKVMKEKIETVQSQNETIARGMIAISDKLEDFMNKNSAPKSIPIQKPIQVSVPQQSMAPPPPRGLPIQHTMGAPQMPGMRTAPPLSFDDAPGLGEPSVDFPPPPPSAGGKKRVGLFR